MRRPYTTTEQVFKVNFGNILYFSAPQADWKQEDETAPDYIKNKPKLVAGENISIESKDNEVIISATGVPTDPDQPDVPVDPDQPDLPDSEGTVVEEIVNKQIPVFFGNESDIQNPQFEILDGKNASYLEVGFYTIVNNNEIQEAGYQVTFNASIDGTSQIILIPKNAKIINTYQYQIAMGQWLSMGFDETYWLFDSEEVKQIGDEEIVYNKYIYNSELWGDPIMSDEHWRFEVEV